MVAPSFKRKKDECVTKVPNYLEVSEKVPIFATDINLIRIKLTDIRYEIL